MLFSFSDLFEKMQDIWRSTVKPSWKNLLSERRNTLRTLLVLTLLETLLCILFFSYSSNLALSETMRDDLNTWRVETSETVEDDSLSEVALKNTIDSLDEHLREVETKNHAVFALSVTAWFLTSAFLFYRALSSSVELKSFVYGLYITFGANTKKIRGFIFCQMLSLALLGLLPSILLARLFCRLVYGFSASNRLSGGEVLGIVGGFSLLLIVVIALIARRITSKTCVTLLSSSDASSYVHSPSRSFRRVDLRHPFRLAAVALLRMRAHHLSVAISAALPICLFFSCMSLAASNEQRRSDTVQAYTIYYENGISYGIFQNDIAPYLQGIEGVESAVAESASPMSYLGGVGAHLLLQSKEVTSDAGLVKAYGGIALDRVCIVSADYYSLSEKNLYPSECGLPIQNGSYTIEVPDEGTALMAYPRSQFGGYPTKYKALVDLGDNTVFLAACNTGMATASLTEKLTSFDGNGLSLRLKPSIIVPNQQNSSGFVDYRLDKEILILNPKDYASLTGIDVVQNIQKGLASPALSLSECGGFLTASGASVDPSIPTAEPPLLYADSAYTLDIADSFAREQYGIPSDTVFPTESGQVTLVLSPFSHLRADLTSLRLSSTGKVDTSKLDLLTLTEGVATEQALATLPQSYRSLSVCDVVVSDQVTTDTLLVTEEDLALLCGREAAYSRVEISLPMTLTMTEIAGVLNALELWCISPQVYADKAELIQSPTLWDAITVESFHYTPLSRTLAVLLLLTVPSVWLCAQYNYYRKRREDLELILILGQPRRRLFAVFASEGILLAALTTLAVCILCPLFTLAVFKFLEFNQFPFAYSAMDTGALVGGIVYSALCAFLTTLFNFFLFFPKKKAKKDMQNLFGDLSKKEV